MTGMFDPFLNGADARAALGFAPARTFFAQWLRDPLQMASVTPSGHQLAQLMVAALPVGAERVVEIGAGTGVFTQALLAAGIAPERLLVVEINPRLAEYLRRRFPRVSVACADARQLKALVAGHAGSGEHTVDAVVSGLGMLSMRNDVRCAILRAAFAALGPRGRFIQFTYGPRGPVRRCEREQLGLRVRRGGFALRNLPPATVYIYERSCTAAEASAPVVN